MLRALPPYTKLEINFQSVHVPTVRPDMDDNAEYVLRTFKVERSVLVPDTLFNTPRSNLTGREKRELASWILANVDAIDRGVAVIPTKFLATRAISVSPRGLVHLENRPFSQLFPDARATFGAASLDGRAFVTTPELLVRRLDEATCQGCHQTRSAAGFHLLGEERDPSATFNALAVGRSPHLTADLGWRERVLASMSRGAAPPSRPFAGYKDGSYGEPCGLASGFASWTCAPGLTCRDLHRSDVGVCVPWDDGSPGGPCENVRTRPSERVEGPVVRADAQDLICGAQHPDVTYPFCLPNWLGFTGGMCTQLCSTVGEVEDGAICAPIPLSGYEADCFPRPEPIEGCLQRHYANMRIATCSADHPCRDDFECARVPGAPRGTGACLPPYFMFQIRVDGPLLDR
jgi:hypothetical protein